MTVFALFALAGVAASLVVGLSWVAAQARLRLRARRVDRWRRAWGFVQCSHVKVLR